MSSETDDKIKIEWNDLHTRKVDQRLKEQEAVERNRRQAELNPLTTTAAAPGSKSLWYNSVFMMACFGLLGGLLAWGGGEALRFRPDPLAEAQTHLKEVADLYNRAATGQISQTDAKSGIEVLKDEYSDNPFFAVNVDKSLTSEQRDNKLAELRKQQSMKDFVANLMSFGLSGMLIAICLSIAEPVVDHNWTGALVNGSVAAAMGLIGGAVVSLFVEQLYGSLVKGAPINDDLSSTRILAHAVSWGVLGLFLTIGPGLIMRNVKKLAIGLLGGLVGGVIGGALFDPIFSATDHNAHLSRLAALIGIGLFAGLGTGLIENAAKNGWLKVTAGLIAGKQFILYRNPTFIGSGPECPIYLFRDAQVGKRHAAIHIVPGGFELENLPLGGDTKINGKNVTRTRLRAGDEIQVGMTTFQFQEKVRT
jgi:Inner membrane component of T3SS, cytoplasmic domain